MHAELQSNEGQKKITALTIRDPNPSIDHKRAAEVLNKTVKKVGDHYSVDLLWKEDNLQLPNNQDMALQRLQGMKKRFKADPQLFKKYRAKIQEYIDCGYAMLVSQSDSAVKKRINYIPRHCVSTAFKFRVVVAFFGCIWFIELRTRKELHPGFMFSSRLLSWLIAPVSEPRDCLF